MTIKSQSDRLIAGNDGSARVGVAQRNFPHDKPELREAQEMGCPGTAQQLTDMDMAAALNGIRLFHGHDFARGP